MLGDGNEWQTKRRTLSGLPLHCTVCTDACRDGNTATNAFAPPLLCAFGVLRCRMHVHVVLVIIMIIAQIMMPTVRSTTCVYTTAQSRILTYTHTASPQVDSTAPHVC